MESNGAGILLKFLIPIIKKSLSNNKGKILEITGRETY